MWAGSLALGSTATGRQSVGTTRLPFMFFTSYMICMADILYDDLHHHGRTSHLKSIYTILASSHQVGCIKLSYSNVYST